MGLAGSVKYLLDTNIVIGLLKGSPDVMALVKQHGFDFDNAVISQITRMELLSFSGMSGDEQHKVNTFLNEFQVLLLNEAIEQETIKIRLAYGIKLPDAVMVATAQLHKLELLTLDKRLGKVAAAEMKKSSP